MITTTGRAYDYKGGVAVKTTRPGLDNLSDEVTILWQDRRQISPEQRRHAWALVGEISAASGYLSAGDRELINSDLKRKFLLERIDELTAEAIKRFSLSDVDMSTARLYIDFLIAFIVEHGIPTVENLAEVAEDVNAYVYACATNRVCAVCRRQGELHHVERVGMGRSRDDICHVGMEALPLCRKHHQEVHQHGDAALMEKYHLEPITIDEKIARLYRLGKSKETQS